jgi:endoglucanase
MNPKELCRLAGRLMSCPAAPYHEAGIRVVVETICAESGLVCKRDRFGNAIVTLRTASKVRPLVLAAHMDHPGFEVTRGIGPELWLARFNGGVPDPFFRAGVRVRLLPGGISAKLGPRVGRGKEFELHGAGPLPLHVPHPRFAVWEVEDFAVRDGKIHGRSCDDLIGVASILATLIELKRSGAEVHVLGAISRAEEIGFQGALALADAGLLPKKSLVISLETSKELPPAKMGGGVIIRVGDRSSIFDSAGTRFLSELAGDLQKRNPRFKFQRALMSGGTCEATAYQEFGYQSVGVCVALGNYHNCGAGGRIAAEFVSVADACDMVALLVEAARKMAAYDNLVGRLPARLQDLLKTARRRLGPSPRSSYRT